MHLLSLGVTPGLLVEVLMPKEAALNHIGAKVTRHFIGSRVGYKKLFDHLQFSGLPDNFWRSFMPYMNLELCMEAW